MARRLWYSSVMLGEHSAVHAGDEHKLALHRERQSGRVTRSRLRQEARQHHRTLASIREGAARDRRLHRSALRENAWLTALAEKILARKKTR